MNWFLCYQLSIDQNETNSTTVVPQVIDNNTKQCNSRAMTLKELQSRLRQYPCVSMDNENNKRRDKRWLGGKTRNQINALKGIINEHRNMINVLVNNSINAIYMLGAIKDHHEKFKTKSVKLARSNSFDFNFSCYSGMSYLFFSIDLVLVHPRSAYDAYQEN